MFKISLAQSYSWSQVVPGNSLGNPIVVDANNNDIVYYGTNDRIYKSWNRGNSFTQIGTSISGSTRIKNIILNPKDSLLIFVAIEGSPQRTVKSTDGGNTWTSTGSFSFSYFGIPTTQDPQHPDTIYTMSGSQFLISTDFGSTWNVKATVSGFGTPCDIEVFPDSSNIILIGDNGTGIFRSSDYGVNWSQVFSTGGEIPTIGMQKNSSGIAWATRWGGGGGFLRSTDYGKSWQLINYFNNLNMWGVDVSPQDSNFVVTGQYSGNRIYISKDFGQTWIPTTIAGSNYAVYVVDSLTVFAAQSTGFYKLQTPTIVTSRPVRVVFSININRALDYHTGERIDSIADGVWLKGSLNALGANQGNWTFADSVNGRIKKLYDNGEGADSIAGDNIWSASFTIPVGTPVSSFTYRYGISYPGIDNLSSQFPDYLNNENAPNLSRTAIFSDQDTIIYLNDDKWSYLAMPQANISPEYISVGVTQGDTAYFSIDIENIQGKDNLLFSLASFSDSILTETFGLQSNIFSDSTDRSNKYFVTTTVTLTEIQQYFEIPKTTEVYFFVYEGEAMRGEFSNVFSTRVTFDQGQGFMSSGPINVQLHEGKYYAIGASWTNKLNFYRGGSVPINTGFGSLISGQVAGASYPPTDIATFRSSNLPVYLQKLSVTSPVQWITASETQGLIPPGSSNSINFEVTTDSLKIGRNFANLLIGTNDTALVSMIIPIQIRVREIVLSVDPELNIRDYSLSQNYPNPFNPSTRISYSLPEKSSVYITIYNSLGEIVDKFQFSEQTQGIYSYDWNASRLASGVYILQLKAISLESTKEFLSNKKMLLLH
ncbi:MAG: T9SS type A sorting domain-containing protein [Ignavibacteria bacterium]|nr:T9SS type A sorting domain-containing protein [Ignavibacteria bacterium]